MHTYIINYRSHSGSRFGLSLVGDSGWGPPFLSSSSMGEGKMQSVSFQDQPAVADDDEATERPTTVAEKEQPQVDTEDDTEDDTVTVGRKGSSWCRRWEEDYGLSMRMANRKYAVPRHVVKERLEIFWVVLFRIRQCIMLAFGYDPLILNFDQSPFHHNETGSQNRPTLGVRGSAVPVVEGNSIDIFVICFLAPAIVQSC